MRRFGEDLKICERATSAPWPVIRSAGRPGRATLGGGIFDGAADSESLLREEDSRFISVAREALPWWITRAQDLEQENRDLRERMDRLTLETE